MMAGQGGEAPAVLGLVPFAQFRLEGRSSPCTVPLFCNSSTPGQKDILM